jgi:glycine/D-amino acid oxidase-like deaminating enzyme
VTDSLPHVGRVPGTQNQYLLGGFNGGGMSFIFKSAGAVADMIRTGCSFKDTGVPAVFETTRKRMKGAGGVEAGY